MKTLAIKHTLRLHLLAGLYCLLGILAGCSGSSNTTPNTAVETDSSEVTPEKLAGLHFGIFSHRIDSESTQTNRGQFKASSELGDIARQKPSSASSSDAVNLTATSSSRSDSCLNIGEGPSSCSSNSTSPDGSSSSSANAEAAGDSTITETNTSEGASSSSSNSSSNHNSDFNLYGSSRTAAEDSIFVAHPDKTNGHSAETLQLFPIGDMGLYAGQISPEDKHVESSNSTISTKVMDYYSGLILASKKTTQVSAGDLLGDYGFISIESNLGETLKFLSVVSEKAISDDMQITESRSNQISILRSAGGHISVLEDVSLHDATGFSLDSMGSVIGTDKKVRGFVNQNASALIYFGQTPAYLLGNSEKGSGLSIALQLPSSVPNLTGQTYRLLSMTAGLSDQGLQLGAITSGEMHFNPDNTVSLNDIVVQKSLLPFAGGDVNLVTTPSNYPNLSFVLEENGLLKMAGIETGEGILEFEGYVSANGEMIVMRSKLTASVSSDIEIGMVVGIVRK